MHSGAHSNHHHHDDSTEDRFRIKILPGGNIKITTDPISAENHASAENLLTNIERASGGSVDIQQKGTMPEHHHHHNEQEHLHGS